MIDRLIGSRLGSARPKVTYNKIYIQVVWFLHNRKAAPDRTIGCGFILFVADCVN